MRQLPEKQDIFEISNIEGGLSWETPEVVFYSSDSIETGPSGGGDGLTQS